MGEILIGQEYEDARIQQQQAKRDEFRKLTGRKWEYYTSYNYADVIQKAKEMGWKEKAVQVRLEVDGEKVLYLIEPWERDCTCPTMLNYKKVFGEE